MGNNEINQERITPYKKKSFVSKDVLLKILLLFVFFGISAFSKYLDKKPESFDIQNLLNLFYSTLGSMVVIAILGYGIAYAIFRNKDKQEKNKYWLIFSILISLLFLLTDIIKKSEEVKTNQNRVVSEQRSNKFYSEEGKYTVSFPGNPTSDNVEIDTAIGKLIMHQSTFSQDEVGYAVNYFDDESGEIMTEERIKEQLISMRDGSLKKTSGRLINSNFYSFTSMSKSNCKGIDFNAEGENSLLIFGRIIRIKNRLYQLFIVTKLNATPKAEIEKFFNSFNSNY